MPTKICNNCKKELNNDNWAPSLRAKNSKICKSCHLENGRRWRRSHKKRAYELTKRWLAKNPNYGRDNSRKDRARLRAEMIVAYGGQCVKCKNDNPIVLDIDHIKNDGGKQRKLGMWGWRLYRWLRKNGYPKKDYQLLCKNCNWIKEMQRRKNDRI